MSFWDDMRVEVRERTTTGDISLSLFQTITNFGVMPLTVVQPTFYMGRAYILCLDYMDYLEKLLDSPEKPERVFQFLLYVRETLGTLGRCVRNAVGPIEEILSALDDIFDARLRKLEANIDPVEEEELVEELSEEDEIEEDEFAAQREAMAQVLRAKLECVEISPSVALELSARLAAMYDCCVRYIRGLRELDDPDMGEEVVLLMRAFTDVQHVLDTQMRHLILEDVYLERTSPFITGIMPWISHAVGELLHKMGQEQ